MNTNSSGAVGFAPVGTFVKDLAQELGKSASTVVAYIKKHLPTALVKRKNANNRLANFALEQAVEAVRAHYLPNADNSLQQELERLRARVQELELENSMLKREQPVLNYTKEPKLSPLLAKYRASEIAMANLREVAERQELVVANVERASLDLPPLTLEQYKEITNVERKKTTGRTTRTEARRESSKETKSTVVNLFRKSRNVE